MGGEAVRAAVVARTSTPAFDAFFRAHRRAVYRFLRFRLTAVADADDCFQETFLSALRAYPTLRDASNLRAWILTIAARKALDLERGRARRDRLEARADPADTTSEPDLALWDAVADLPPKQRLAVGYRFMVDLPYSDIARLMDISEVAARQNVRAGLKKLREVVER